MTIFFSSFLELLHHLNFRIIRLMTWNIFVCFARLSGTYFLLRISRETTLDGIIYDKHYQKYKLNGSFKV